MYQVAFDRHGAVEFDYAASAEDAAKAGEAGQRRCACGSIHSYVVYGPGEHLFDPSAPTKVPDDFDIRIDTHTDGGIFRRYAAGIASILDRAELRLEWEICRVQNRNYPDQDLEVYFEAGDFQPGPLAGHPEWNHNLRYARVNGRVAWHMTGGGNLTDQPLYISESATITVLSRSGSGEATTFAIRPSELTRIKIRVRDVILRDHLVGATREINAWRWEDDRS